MNKLNDSFLSLLPNPLAAGSKGMGLRLLAFRDCGFESCRCHGCLSLVSSVYCKVEFSASGRSLVQRSSTECGVSNLLIWSFKGQNCSFNNLN
jgi:hypothetical protein